MKIRTSLLAAVAVLALVASPVLAGPGGNGGGQGNGASNGNGGNSAGAGSQGHGAATSAAAKDKSTKGIAHAMAVVATTPASPQATLSLQAALDKFLARKAEDDDPAESSDDTSGEIPDAAE
ncbi:hypothetical protein [Mesorhizobium sp.]|uniref:hypothetical protein n=1 Tax=Mesorhizobium sp. TaxID=1871066 RepID=UPI0011FF1DA5|nr:hypothetical protein [Mesorhizobium sp.]TIO06538.1 MAG: hypothetical protein E5X88_21795 [Mesorhizobium sp.]TIO31558.1 MAG: hypothetical protein E5X89_23745 [Mesorhizobium sp.]TIP08344.1 MAG: hypothetical protein E5X73_32560 [Mesorhizobium sp.]